MSVRSCFAILILAVLFTIDTTSAQVANPELEACRATGLIALREMLWGGGEDIASIVADVNRRSAPCRS